VALIGTNGWLLKSHGELAPRSTSPLPGFCFVQIAEPSLCICGNAAIAWTSPAAAGHVYLQSAAVLALGGRSIFTVPKATMSAAFGRLSGVEQRSNPL
jgi:hypothetical protein